MFTMRNRRHRYGFALTAVAVVQVALATIANADPSCPCMPDRAAPVSDNPDMYTGPIQPLLPFPQPPSPPEFDPFYRPDPARFVDLKPGQIIAARQVNFAGIGVIPLDVEAWQLSFRSNNSRDEPIAAVTTVVKPHIGPSPRKLLSYQVPEDSLANYCAPSYNFQLASVPGNYMGQVEPAGEMLQPFQQALRQGWNMNIPDHQGPNSAFYAGPLGGRITLDSIRAAENFYPMDLDGRHTPVVMQGHLGGGPPTQFAAELHHDYAPDLNLKGAAVNSPLSDLAGLVAHNSGNLAGPSIFDAMIGISREYPDFGRYLDEHMDGVGKAIRDVHGVVCMGWAGVTPPYQNYMGSLPPNVFDDPAVKYAMDENRYGNRQPDIPMYYYQPALDWVMPTPLVDDFINNTCRDHPDASIHYVRDHASEILTIPYMAQPSIDRWLTERVDGIPAAEGCSVSDVATMASPNNANGDHGDAASMPDAVERSNGN